MFVCSHHSQFKHISCDHTETSRDRWLTTSEHLIVHLVAVRNAALAHHVLSPRQWREVCGEIFMTILSASWMLIWTHERTENGEERWTRESKKLTERHIFSSSALFHLCPSVSLFLPSFLCLTSLLLSLIPSAFHLFKPPSILPFFLPSSLSLHPPSLVLFYFSISP